MNLPREQECVVALEDIMKVVNKVAIDDPSVRAAIEDSLAQLSFPIDQSLKYVNTEEAEELVIDEFQASYKMNVMIPGSLPNLEEPAYNALIDLRNKKGKFQANPSVGAYRSKVSSNMYIALAFPKGSKNNDSKIAHDIALVKKAIGDYDIFVTEKGDIEVM